MTRVDFYVLKDQCEEQRINMVCRLAEKAVKQSKRVFIHTDDELQASAIDAALWRFREDAFVPHRLQDVAASAHSGAIPSAPDTSAEAVIIGSGSQPQTLQSVLINLSRTVPHFFSRFERTLEIVNQQDEVRSSGRDRYSFYQQRGYPLQHHNV